MLLIEVWLLLIGLLTDEDPPRRSSLSVRHSIRTAESPGRGRNVLSPLGFRRPGAWPLRIPGKPLSLPRLFEPSKFSSLGNRG